ncbi:hypothetical protein AHMF7605_03605 [Adhaeribacter arboris]|uniref:ATPase AAA-type core domain-containing protein n=1 Tax=Adhaeribacter arboris TaxID=2072846 RepID=A0A2T2YAZ4_9BACT|nr:hypothetical protein [Adhaeribacter arboris]PSR52674.1 hypothetical protein AHMF7605_03605 [Adhaeribacter arboris]
MLTYIIKNKHSTLFIIDEPDIYLHSDLQRQLLGILKNLGPDIIIAIHSTELISETEINDILIINKHNQSARRIKNPLELQKIFDVLGSNLNPILTQIAKTRGVLFVEGKDFLLFSRFARKLKLEHVANRSDFAVIPVEGFNPFRLKVFKEGIERTIGTSILSAVIFDRDYRSDEEIDEEEIELKKDNYFVHIHSNKELENFLIIPIHLRQTINKRIEELNLKTGKEVAFDEDMNQILENITEDFKIKIQSQLQAKRIPYEKKLNKHLDDSTIFAKLLKDFEEKWKEVNHRFKIIPGKEFLSCLNEYLQKNYSITISQTNIINNISPSEFPKEMKELLIKIDNFRKASVINNQ